MADHRVHTINAHCANQCGTAYHLPIYTVLLAFMMIIFSTALALSNEPIIVNMDHAKIMRVNVPAQTVIIGNPLIADVMVPENNLMVITGKSYGKTNLIMIDKEGTIIAEYPIIVSSSQDSLVTVYRQTDRSTVSCAPNCEQYLKAGDAPKYFGNVASSITQRNSLSKGQAEAGAKNTDY